jgi:hypothetical protein
MIPTPYSAVNFGIRHKPYRHVERLPGRKRLTSVIRSVGLGRAGYQGGAVAQQGERPTAQSIVAHRKVPMSAKCVSINPTLAMLKHVVKSARLSLPAMPSSRAAEPAYPPFALIADYFRPAPQFRHLPTCLYEAATSLRSASAGRTNSPGNARSRSSVSAAFVPPFPPPRQSPADRGNDSWQEWRGQWPRHCRPG